MRGGAERAAALFAFIVLPLVLVLAGARAAVSGHWAFRPVARPALPEVRLESWPGNAIDRFVLARLEAAGIAPSGEADRATLARRLYLDLLGLPPPPEEVDAFARDERPDAWERLVDRVLASPRHGERWGRHWLDQARYADSDGYTNDSPRSMWPFRDWVIRALNDDLSFDQFTIEQLAGDLLSEPADAQLIATAFHRNTLINTEGGVDREQFRVEAAVDRVSTTGQVWLGLTVGCAQCHDHKFDPLTQKEFYELYAFFDSAVDENDTEPVLRLASGAERRRASELEERIAALGARLKESAGESAGGAPLETERAPVAAETKKLEAEKKGLEEEKKKLESSWPTVMVMREREKPRATHVHVRGDFLRPGEPVAPNVPRVMPPLSGAAGRPGRLELARWLVSAENPLTARVTVNRIWMRLFGRGLVETENDFGTQGTPPTHPELLDWLAAEFAGGGWSSKRLLRLIVTSATYKQSSHARADLAEVDPLNKLLARQSRLRVEAEIVRDLALAASGLLSSRIGGPSVHPPQPPGVYDFTQVAKSWKTSGGEDRYRRGLYTFFYRSAPYPMLTTFDAPRFNATCTRRLRSDTPLQSLTLANDPSILEMARALGERVLEEGAAGDDRARARRAFRLALAREPSAWELERLLEHFRLELASFTADPAAAGAFAARAPGDGADGAAAAAAWAGIARVLFNLDEFVTRE
jgi:hypothetical protein